MAKELVGNCRIIQKGRLLAIKINTAILDEHTRHISLDGSTYIILDIEMRSIYLMIQNNRRQQTVTIRKSGNGS